MRAEVRLISESTDDNAMLMLAAVAIKEQSLLQRKKLFANFLGKEDGLYIMARGEKASNVTLGEAQTFVLTAFKYSSSVSGSALTFLGSALVQIPAFK